MENLQLCQYTLPVDDRVMLSNHTVKLQGQYSTTLQVTVHAKGLNLSCIKGKVYKPLILLTPFFDSKSNLN